MACEIVYKDKWVLLNDMQFARLIDFVIEVGDGTAATASEQGFVARPRRLRPSARLPRGRSRPWKEGAQVRGRRKSLSVTARPCGPA